MGRQIAELRRSRTRFQAGALITIAPRRPDSCDHLVHDLHLGDPFEPSRQEGQGRRRPRLPSLLGQLAAGARQPAHPRRRPDADARRPTSRRSRCRPRWASAGRSGSRRSRAYDARGPGWYWNNFSCGEHTGTHFDAPIHWISGRDLPNNSVDTIPAQHFVAPACVIDCSREATADPDYLLTVARHRALRGARTAASRGRLVPDAHRLVEAHRSRGLPELRRDRPAHARAERRGGAASWSSSATCSASARGDRHRRRPGLPPAPAVSLPLLHARRRTLRPAVPRQPRPAAADRRGC